MGGSGNVTQSTEKKATKNNLFPVFVTTIEGETAEAISNHCIEYAFTFKRRVGKNGKLVLDIYSER